MNKIKEKTGFTDEMLDMTLSEFVEWSLKGGLAPIITFEDKGYTGHSWEITLQGYII